jgi:hypothetical protein
MFMVEKPIMGSAASGAKTDQEPRVVLVVGDRDVVAGRSRN